MTKREKMKIKKAALRAKELDEILKVRARVLAGIPIPYDFDPETPGYWDLDAEYEDNLTILRKMLGVSGYHDALTWLKNNE